MIGEFTNRKSLIFLIFLCLAIGAYFVFTSSVAKNSSLFTTKSDSEIKNAARDEFSGAYTESVDPTGTVIAVELEAAVAEITLVDGSTTKVWAYNGTVPGPEITAKVGDTVQVSFTNNLPQETTIHWHGVRVTNAMDGVPGVTQDPIQPGEQFVYEFIPKDVGTFWFHPHVRGAEQVEKGLYGTLIVTGIDEPEYESDTTLVVDDWRLTDANQIDPFFVTTHDVMHDGRWGQLVTTNGKKFE